ncbi:MAG: PLP-dependent aminotransferase family protein [Bacillota bacterium]|nr:PLP-dependent aminotransferase family protein [Bacillota bacterium]MDW7677739.1 PLP-dependent aminotransferase family protein [Bacillota bacterium]
MKDWMNQITLNEHSTEHRYMQIYRQFKELILTGVIPFDERLPSVRRLAAALNINTVTVVKAYDLLERESLVRKETGSGTYVDYGRSVIALAGLAEDDWNPDAGQTVQISYQRSVSVTVKSINFASATPSPDLFPVEDFKQALLEVLDRDQGYAFGYQDPRGYDPLREAVGKLAAAAGIQADPNSIQIISGAQQGIDLVAKGLVYPGENVLIERPSYGGAMQAFFSRSARVVDIPLEKDGIHLDKLEKAILETRPRLLYVMPNFQNPTGVSYTREKKERIIALSEKYDFLVLEDDYLNELSFGPEPAHPLKAQDRHDRVIYIKSFSKMFMPGLRLGYLIVPQAVSKKLLAAKQSTDISTSGLLQRALERYLTTGAWEQNLKRLADEYQQRFHQMAGLLREWMPSGVTFDEPAGGLNFWLRLPESLKVQMLYNAALERQLIFAPGSLFYLRKPDENCLRLSIAAVRSDQIDGGIRLLAQLIRLRMRLDDAESPTSMQYQDPIL